MNPDDTGAGRVPPWYLELERAGGFDFAAGDLLAFDLAADDPLGWTRGRGRG